MCVTVRVCVCVHVSVYVPVFTFVKQRTKTYEAGISLCYLTFLQEKSVPHWSVFVRRSTVLHQLTSLHLPPVLRDMGDIAIADPHRTVEARRQLSWLSPPGLPAGRRARGGESEMAFRYVSGVFCYGRELEAHTSCRNRSCEDPLEAKDCMLS